MALPFILAGPIVRRVTARSVSVWAALSEAATATLSIWDKVVATGPGDAVFVPTDPPLHSASRQTLRIGKKLHIALVTIDVPPPPVLPLFPGRLYSYNLAFAGASGNVDLKSLKLLIDAFPTENDPHTNLALGYMPHVLPSFVLPPVAIDKFNLVHGSCRKFHGPGKDTLAVLDGIIRKAINDNDADQRPHQLFLTGDQIYADEIPTLLLPAINALGAELLGVKENITAKKNDGSTAVYEATMANFPVTRRQRIVTRNAKFTTGEGANHLLSFGEFAATYLMCWNNAIWSKELHGKYEQLKDKEDFLATWDTYPLTTVEQALAPLANGEQIKASKEKIKDDFKKAYQEELRQTITFRTQLPKVRRVLANVPVYMIMDDHEVTDDWYITRDWRDKVLTAPLGVNILRNALTAYALFQDWGNEPATYTTPEWAVQKTYQKGDYVRPSVANGHIYRAIQGGTSGASQPAWPTTKAASIGDNSVVWQEAGTDRKAQLLNQAQLLFPESVTSGPASAPAAELDVLFGFNLTDETPPPVLWHYAVPASETTIYVLDTRTRRTYETRHSPPGLLSASAMDDQIPLSPQPERFLIFVSPAPVLGLGTLEELLQPGMTVFSAYEADPEPWSFHPVVFEAFLRRLQIFKRVLFLSGDVHFGLTGVLDYWKKGEPKPARFVQFVSSGLKNQKFSNEQFLLGGLIQRMLASLFHPGERLGWTLRSGLQVSNPGGKPNQPSYRVRLRKEPVLLPARGWPQGTTVNQPPDWSWRLALAGDERRESARPVKIQVPSILPDVYPATQETYEKVLQRHVEVFKKNAARRVQWDNNIAIVKFTTGASGDVVAAQQLWYWLPADEPDDDPDAYTVYTRSLEPTAESPPSIS
jgi:hypothetical protein